MWELLSLSFIVLFISLKVGNRCDGNMCLKCVFKRYLFKFYFGKVTNWIIVGIECTKYLKANKEQKGGILF